MELADSYTILWLIWGAIFFAIEIPALIRKRRGDTLTDHQIWLRKWRVKGVPVGLTLFIMFWSWLTLHFFGVM